MAESETAPNPLVQAGELAARQGGLLESALVGGEPQSAPLGELVGAGELGLREPVRAVVFELVREGYLCHYGVPRLLESDDADLALLLGDLLYAVGLRELAALGEPGPVELLASLISLSAEMEAAGLGSSTGGLWLARAVALGTGNDPAEPALVEGLLEGDNDAPALLEESAWKVAEDAGVGAAFGRAREAIQ